MNEEELGKIKEIEQKLSGKKRLTGYELGQLDLIALLREKKKPTNFEKVLNYGLVVVISFAVLTFIYGTYIFITRGDFSIEFATDRYTKNFLIQKYTPLTQ